MIIEDGVFIGSRCIITEGAIVDAVNRARDEGLKVSTCQLTFLSPLEPGLKEIFSRFKKVMTVEINYSDELPLAQGIKFG